MGCELLEQELFSYINGDTKAVEQDESKVTIARKIEKEESLIDWKKSALQIHNKVRAFTMGPGTYVMFQGKRLKIHKTKVIDGTANVASHISEVNTNELVIETGEGLLSLIELQPESKSKLSVSEFLKSIILKKGDSFV